MQTNMLNGAGISASMGAVVSATHRGSSMQSGLLPAMPPGHGATTPT